MNVAIVGGGTACANLLRILDEDCRSRLKMKILGVADEDPGSAALRYAGELHLFTSTRFQDLLSLTELNMIIDLTGSARVKEEILRIKPDHVSLLDETGLALLRELIRKEDEKTEMERTYRRDTERIRKETQVIMDSLPYRIMVVNMDFRIDAVNQTFLKKFKIMGDNILGNHCYRLKYGLDRPCAELGRVCHLHDNLDEIRKKGSFSAIKEFRQEDGSTRFDVITIAPIYSEEGEITQMLEASRDVTDRIEMEREIQKSNTFFENVIKSTVDGIVAVDTKGNVIIFNEGMERLTGYSSKEVKHLTTFYPISTAKENMRKMRSDQYGPYGKLNPTSMTITTKSGEEVPVTLSASLILMDGKQAGSVGVFTDMREILQMRKNLEEAQFQLVQSEKIASVGRMAAGVAHEINNPLAGILIYAELLKENLKGDVRNLRDAQEIIDQTLRCKKIVSELLEFSRQAIGKVSAFSLEDLIGKSLNLLIHQAIFQDIEVIKEVEPGIPEMVGDFGQLQQVLINLFTNSADAMEGKGSLCIRAGFDSWKNEFIIKVSDTGPGIPEALRDKIFDIFFTTKAVGKGTGLGLSISRNIIQLHGGSIMVDSPPGGGTTFIIELPLGFVEQPVQEPVFIGLEE